MPEQNREINFREHMAAPEADDIFAPKELVHLRGVVDEQKELLLAAERGRLAETEIEDMKSAIELLKIADNAEDKRFCEAEITSILIKFMKL